MKAFRTDRTVIRPADFLQYRENQCLEISPKFQRRGVWKLPARSYFIDTILRGMPVPPIYLRALPPKKGQTKIVHEVVDGQQRIRTVLDFIDGNFRLSRSLDPPWSGRLFHDLNEKDQQQILMFAFPAEVFENISDADVLKVFARLNTYSVPLNKQELRNGKYFGPFKKTAYRLANDHYKFWERHSVFTERGIARMLEVELTSELLIAGHVGMQDKKKSVDDFYLQWDDEYPGAKTDESRFTAVCDEINETFSGTLSDTEFSRPPFFYTLYCVLFHHLFSLPKEKLPTPKRGLTEEKRLKLREGATMLSEVLSDARDEGGTVPVKYAAFVKACLSQTDNIKPRQTRFEHLWKAAF